MIGLWGAGRRIGGCRRTALVIGSLITTPPVWGGLGAKGELWTTFLCRSLNTAPPSKKETNNLKKKSKNEPRLDLAVVTSFFVSDAGALSYQASVYPSQGGEKAWLAILFGAVGHAPDIPDGSSIPVAHRAQIAKAVQKEARREFRKLVKAVMDSQAKGVIQ